ncbi:MAG: asparagine synthase B [Halobacteriovoraceae bacterium]|nr:asparagine synthase B [Halobacteriovoraceae bacterium]MCB9095398.1 asparagine synthase B [Halobacteriovoraceae bacterium]
MCGFLVSTDPQQSLEGFETEFQKLAHRGPDHHVTVKTLNGIFGFHRLSIMDLSESGNQPFESEGDVLVCNGEIYNHRSLKSELSAEFSFHSHSDCEVLLPLIRKYGIKKAMKKLDAEFALVMWSEKDKKFFAARDPIGIRPLFYGKLKTSQKLIFSSELKALSKICETVETFPPGHYYDGTEILPYVDLTTHSEYCYDSIDKIYQQIHDKLVRGVVKRLDSDAPLGFLLSGGLDSSLVCSIAAKHLKKPIKTFSIGMETDAIDLKYARDVAKSIGSDHTDVIMTKDDVLEALKEVIWHLETYDITTIRASIGMYLVCKYIKEHTPVKVILTGEVSDEIFGYKYTDFAPNAEEFQAEAKKRVDELYMYDVLRADRCISANSLEARVPFSDQDFVHYVMSLNPIIKMNQYGAGKFLLRKAFDHSDYLPHHILWREKAAFSDAVGHSMVDYLKQAAEEKYTEEDLTRARDTFLHALPFTKESLMYREIFEELFPGRSYLVKDFWMPNKSWKNCDVQDPSARVLPNYGKSGS